LPKAQGPPIPVNLTKGETITGPRLTPSGRLVGRPAKRSRVVIVHTRLMAGSVPPVRPSQPARVRPIKPTAKSVAATAAMRQRWGK
jgi:hypothetical protein